MALSQYKDSVFILGRRSERMTADTPLPACDAPFTVKHTLFNISRTKSQNLTVSRLVLWSLSNPLEPGIKSRMKM